MLEVLEGVVCQVDDILVYGETEAERHRRLSNVLKRLEEAQIPLNKEKCGFFQQNLCTIVGMSLIKKASFQIQKNRQP